MPENMLVRNTCMSEIYTCQKYIYVRNICAYFQKYIHVFSETYDD